MSDTSQQRHDDRPGPLAWLLESFWIADVLVVGMLAFFVIVGGSSSTAVVVIGCVLAVLYAAHAVHRHHERSSERSMEARRMRERRGF
jgi:hypothetical protein